jgi:uncharacterized tellurite resistance protein B-like protein
MIKRLRLLLLGEQDTAEQTSPEEERQSVIAALLVQAAMMDGHFDDTERQTIEQLMVSEFSLDQKDVTTLIDDASTAVEQSSQLFGFTRQAVAQLDHDGRIRLIEMLWQVVYSDGIVHDFETSLMRRIAGLLHVSDRETAQARQRVIS